MFKRIISKETKLLVIFTALIILSIPTSAQINNCCGVDRQCDTDEQWISGYWAFQNNQCVAPSQQQGQSTSSQSQPQSEPSEDIDNCCFVDRQCMTDEQWVNGYNAFQNNQCAAPSQQQRGTSSQSQSQPGTSEDIDNCCFIGWQCNADAEWTSGYFAYQEDQCDSSQSDWQAQWRHLQRQQQQNSNRQQSSSEGRLPVKRTYDPYTRVTTFEYEDGSILIARPPTEEEFCEALENLGLPLPPECEDE